MYNGIDIFLNESQSERAVHRIVQLLQLNEFDKNLTKNNVPDSRDSSKQPLIIVVFVLSGLLFVTCSIIILLLHQLRIQKKKNMEIRANNFAPREGPMALIFTDIEKSSTLWAENSHAMQLSLALHNELIRQVISQFKAYEVKTVGDAFFIALKSVMDAVKLCVEIQITLLNAPWPSDLLKLSAARIEHDDEGRKIFSGLRVRIGLNYGDAHVRYDNISKGYDYYGNSVNETSRVESVGHGGQILATSSVINQLNEQNMEMEYGIQWEWRSNSTLKGMSAPTEIYEIYSLTKMPRRLFPILKLNSSKDNKVLETTRSLVAMGLDESARFTSELTRQESRRSPYPRKGKYAPPSMCTTVTNSEWRPVADSQEHLTNTYLNPNSPEIQAPVVQSELHPASEMSYFSSRSGVHINVNYIASKSMEVPLPPNIVENHEDIELNYTSQEQPIQT